MSMAIKSDSSTDLGSNLDIPCSPSDTMAVDTPVGLSDPQIVAHKRRMLDVVNRLRATG
jgi:hypothetical protein